MKKATNSITFNTADLTLGSLSLTSSSLNEPYVQPASALQIDTKAERATLQLPATLPEGSTAQLKVGFQAELTGGMMGYYRSAFEQDGKTKYYSLTQFEVRLHDLFPLSMFLNLFNCILAYGCASRIPLLG